MTAAASGALVSATSALQAAVVGAEEAPPDGVILVILDSLRRDHVGCYGNSWIKTPTIDGLAKQSVKFLRAFPESLPTLPVRRALHTGNRSFPFRDYEPRKGDPVRIVGWQPIPEEQVTLAETLKHAGFRTAFITDTYHQFKPSMNFHRGFDEWQWIRGQETDPLNSASMFTEKDLEKYTPLSGRGYRPALARYLANMSYRKEEPDWLAPRVFATAMSWLEANRDAKRFFLCVDSFDPHEPWDPPYPYRELYYPGYKGREVIWPEYGKSDYLSPDELRYMRACYAGEVTMVDAWLGKFVDKARSLGMLDRALLVVISDHGHQLGEHGLTGKIPAGLYPELMDIPLLIRHPSGTGADSEINALVYNHDVFATILGRLGIEPPLKTDSRDLWPLLRGDQQSARSYLTSGFANAVWARDDDYCYIADRDGGNARLYDLKADPEQRTNVISVHKDVAEQMQRRILADAGGSLPDNAAKARRHPDKWYQLY